MPTEREVLIAVMKILYSENPACSCCDGDAQYEVLRDNCATEAAKVGCTVTAAHEVNEYGHKVTTYEVVG